MSKNKFEVGDIIVDPTNGFQRKIGLVIDGYENAQDRFGYYYYRRFDNSEDWTPIPQPCSQGHLQSWGDKVGHEPTDKKFFIRMGKALHEFQKQHEQN